MNKAVIYVLWFLILAGCNLNGTQTFLNDNIPPGIKEEINKLDAQIIRAIQLNRTEEIKAFLADKLIEEAGQDKMDSIFSLVSHFLGDNEFMHKDQFYIKNTSKNISNTIFSGLSNDDDYIIHYKALNKNMFISTLLTKNTGDEHLITLIYGLYENVWKLNIFQFGLYSISNKTAIDYYNLAKHDYENGFLIDAANNLFIGQQCLRPGHQVIQYRKEKEFFELQKEVMTQIHSTYVLPMTVEQVKTKPQIFNIHPQRVAEGNFPMIRYYSKIGLQDTIRLKQENLEMQKLIGDLFKGIDKNNKYIFYWAFDELPDGTLKNRQHYGFVQETEALK